METEEVKLLIWDDKMAEDLSRAAIGIGIGAALVLGVGVFREKLDTLGMVGIWLFLGLGACFLIPGLWGYAKAIKSHKDYEGLSLMGKIIYYLGGPLIKQKISMKQEHSSTNERTIFFPWLTLFVIILIVSCSTIIQMNITELCTTPAMLLSTPFFVLHELNMQDGMLQNYIFFTLLVLAYECLCWIEKEEWRSKLLIFVFAILASYSTTAYTCIHTPEHPGAGSSILAFSMTIMIVLWMLSSKLFMKNSAGKVIILLLVVVFIWGYLIGSSGLVHALGGFFFLALITIAYIVGLKIPFIKQDKHQKKDLTSPAKG